MNNKKIFVSFFLCVLILFSGCNSGGSKGSMGEPFEKEIYALDTYINLKIYGDNAETAAKLAEKEIMDLEALLSVTNPESDVSKINMSSGELVPVSEDTFNVVKSSLNVSSRTNGALDISVYPIVKLWGFTTDEKRVPSQSEIDETLKLVDYRNIQVDEDTFSVKHSPSVEIDLGAAAKGYISEKIKNLLKEQGIEMAVLSFGGNIQTIGTKNGNPWKVGIKYPFTEESFSILNVEETAVVTSATDQRYFESEGKRYHHIIDPKSGYPVENGTVSVTVVCESGTSADALSTALFVMGADNAAEFYKTSDMDFEFVILYDNDKVIVSEGLKEKFRCTEAYDYLNVEFAEK